MKDQTIHIVRLALWRTDNFYRGNLKTLLTVESLAGAGMMAEIFNRQDIADEILEILNKPGPLESHLRLVANLNTSKEINA